MPRTAKAGTNAKNKAKPAKKAVSKPTAKSKKPAAARRTSAARPVAGRMLSKSTQRAKWIENVTEHEDRHGQTLVTRSHEVIQQWAQERSAVPATVESTRHGDRPGVLRFDFPGFSGGKSLQQISWEEWFKIFDERELLFLFQEHLKNGNQSNFFRLDNPNREAA